MQCRHWVWRNRGNNLNLSAVIKKSAKKINENRVNVRTLKRQIGTISITLTLTSVRLSFLLGFVAPFSAFSDIDDDHLFGPAFSTFRLTLQSGYREEAAGPLFYSQQTDRETQMALPPFYSQTLTPDVGWSEWEVFYPVIDYRRFGSEYRMQFFEFLSFSGGNSEQERGVRRFTLFPIFFWERSPDVKLNYTALAPFGGELKNRLFRDDIKFVLFPLYSETRKRDVVTDNYLYPIFDVRRGDHMTGWQVWPLTGVEHKAPTSRTNQMNELQVIGGYDRFFALWPFYSATRSGLGTTNPAASLTIIPFYSQLRSPSRDETSYGWPFGVNSIDDREKNYVEHDVLWPLFVRAHGSKTVTRYFPFYSRAHNLNLQSDFCCWPIYKFNRLESGPLDRTRTRILFFLYSDTVEKNTASKEFKRRVDFWPFYTFRRDLDGNRRCQALTLLEPFFPNSRSVAREYSQVWSLWRDEHNARTGDSSQSLLWNLFRRETTPGARKFSLLFGFFQYQSTTRGESWRVGYCNFGKKPAPATPKS
jgi:hypothetical protein